MSELVFPVTATLLVYLVAAPLLTVVVRGLLEVFSRRWPHPHEGGRAVVVAGVMAPVALPVVAVLAAALHRIDGHHAYEVCLSLHSMADPCNESVMLAAMVMSPLVLAGVTRLRPGRRRGRRMSALERSSLAIDGCEVPIYVVAEPVVCVRGFVNPWIEVGETVISALSTAQLRSAVLHELAHVGGFDPLFGALGRVFIALNPAGGLLESWLERWRLGREIRCDLAAVEAGADRFELAEALLRVARLQPDSGGLCASHLTGAAASLRVRVVVLVGGDSPRVNDERGTLLLVALVLGAFVAACLFSEMTFLDALHHRSELFFHRLF